MSVSDPPIEFEHVTRKTLRGALAFSARQVFCQVLGAATGIVLARLLSPAEFGLYAIIGFLFFLFHALSDLGLGASLVRQPVSPPEQSYRLMFLVRLAVDLTIGLGVWFAAPRLASAYGLESDRLWLFRLLALASWLTSFMVVPITKLERKVAFGELALVEVAQQLTRSLLLISLVLAGFGVLSFPLAWMGFAFVGVCVASWFQPWRPGVVFNASELRERLPFALPYQASGLLHLVRDGVTPLLVGITLGSAEVGYLNWAEMFVMFSVFPVVALQRVYMPAFAQVQTNRDALSDLVQQALTASHALSAPFAVLSLVLAEQITSILFGRQWLSGLSLFYGLWLITLVAPSTNPLISLLNALGRSKQVLKYLCYTNVALWGLSFLLLPMIGSRGYLVAVLLVQTAAWMLYRMVSDSVSCSIPKAMIPGWVSAAVMGGVVFVISRSIAIDGLVSLLLISLFAAVLYVAALLCCFGSSFAHLLPIRRIAADVRRAPLPRN